MDANTAAGAFGLLGALGFAGIAGLAALFMLVLPIWAIVDAAGREDKDSRVIWIVVMIVSWGLGSLIYGLFGTKTKSLRRFTALAIVFLIIGFALTISSCIGALALGRKAEQGRLEVEKAHKEEVLANLRNDARDPGNFVPAYGLLPTGMTGSATLVQYGPSGPDLAAARALDTELRYVTADAAAQVIYGLTDHDFGTVSPDGHFQILKPPPEIKSVSWGSGLAYDASSKKVLIASRAGADSALIRFDPATSAWTRLNVNRGFEPLAIAADPENNKLYVLPELMGKRQISRIEIRNLDGAQIGGINLSMPLPFEATTFEKPQLMYSGGLLILIPTAKSSDPTRPRPFFIQVQTGEVFYGKEAGLPAEKEAAPPNNGAQK